MLSRWFARVVQFRSLIAVDGSRRIEPITYYNCLASERSERRSAWGRLETACIAGAHGRRYTRRPQPSASIRAIDCRTGLQKRDSAENIEGTRNASDYRRACKIQKTRDRRRKGKKKVTGRGKERMTNVRVAGHVHGDSSRPDI
ncbi:hypothetical protein PUN28_014960 [Cardiocondyla obscurior]|uniref:Uncharacterized protein n=1 Tax=Cardiocondyla obscurior TaxID=286306 RepID=A0AAW2EWB8_9HYME